MQTRWRWLRTLSFALAALFAGAVAGALPPVAQFFASVDANRMAWLIVTIAGATVGFVLMMGGILDLLMAQDRALSRADAEDVERSVRLSARPVGWRAASYRAPGRTTGSSGSDSFTLRELKQAWRSGVWRRDPGWRRRFITAVGAFLLFVGAFGLVFAVSPPSVKSIVGVALCYGMIMLMKGWWRA